MFYISVVCLFFKQIMVDAFCALVLGMMMFVCTNIRFHRMFDFIGCLMFLFNGTNLIYVQ